MTHPEYRCDYDNLVYACCQCNALKQEAQTVITPPQSGGLDGCEQP
jgi:hypothetical protein